MEVDTLKNILKQNDYSLTKARLFVFESLIGKEPQTMKQLINSTKSVNRASIYRTIDLFDNLGVIHKINVGWKYKIELTDLFHSHHHHLHCTICQTIIPLAEDRLLEERIAGLASKNGFKISRHHLEVIGECANCSTK